MHNDKELHLTCDCHSHELHIEKGYEGDEPPMWFGSFWVRGYRENLGWRWKWSQIWQILRKGRPYGDEIVLSEEQMKELSDYIQEQLKSIEGK